MGFLKVFIGTIFLFDLRFNGVDILPDFIGYILIVWGLNQLLHLSDRFRIARNLAAVLVFTSLFDLYQAPHPTSEVHLIMILFGLAVTVIYLCYIYFLCKGIIEIAAGANELQLASNANLVMVLEFIIAICTYFVLLVPVLAILIFIVSIFVFIFQLYVLYTASQKFDNKYDS